MNLCWIILFHMFQPDASISYQRNVVKHFPDTFKLCRQVVAEAKRQGVDPALAVAIAYHETRISYIQSDKGAQGPLGVIPKYHCPKQGACDLVKAGVSAIVKWQAARKDTCAMLAGYNRGFKGKCEEGRSEYIYAKAVMNTVNKLKSFNK